MADRTVVRTLADELEADVVVSLLDAFRTDGVLEHGASFGVDRDERGARVQESIEVLRTVCREAFPELDGEWGRLEGDLDVLPKPTSGSIPLLPTGYARQSLEWIADHGNGWLFYHLPNETLQRYLEQWRSLAGEQPFAIAVRVELAAEPDADPKPCHLGYHAGVEWFREYVARLEGYGLNYVIVGLESEEPEQALTTFAEEVIATL